MVGDNMYGSDNPRDFERKFELPSSRFVQYFVIGNSASCDRAISKMGE